METQPTTGAERASALLSAKLKANEALYAGLPQLGSPALRMATETRQTTRRWARDNQKCPWLTDQVSDPARLRACAQVMARAVSRKRLSPRPAPRHPKGLKHAWQRKAAFWAAVRAALANDAVAA